MERNYIPESMGLTTGISSNLGEVKSKGVDASIDYNQAFSSGLFITGRANFTYATNEIILNGDPIYEFDNLSRIGYPVNQPFGLIAERLFIDAEDIALKAMKIAAKKCIYTNDNFCRIIPIL